MSKTGVPGVDWFRGRLRVRLEIRHTPFREFFDPDAATLTTGHVSPALRTKIEQWKAKKKTEVGGPLLRGRPHSVTPGTMDADGQRYLRRIEGKTRFKSDRSHWRAVCATEIQLLEHGPLVRVGSLGRTAFTTEVLDLCIAAWQKKPPKHVVRRVRVAAYEREGVEMPGYERAAPATSGRVVPAATIRHRVRVVRDLWNTLGPPYANPADACKQPSTPKANPKAVPEDVIIAVGRNLAAAIRPRTRVRPARDPAAWALRELKRQREALLTWVRYLVLVTTGQRPCQLMRATADDVQLAEHLWVVRDAKLEPAHCLQLTAEMSQAWDLFISADAWGEYDTSTHADRVHAAGWPKGIRPYNSRHSIVQHGTNKQGIDLTEMQTVTGHKQIETLRTHYEGLVVDGRSRNVSKKLEGRLRELFALRVAK